jgi:hypothetical protein
MDYKPENGPIATIYYWRLVKLIQERRARKKKEKHLKDK